MSGTIEVKRPRVRILEERFESRILPLFLRRTHEVTSCCPSSTCTGCLRVISAGVARAFGRLLPCRPRPSAVCAAKWEEEFETWQIDGSKRLRAGVRVGGRPIRQGRAGEGQGGVAGRSVP